MLFFVLQNKLLILKWFATYDLLLKLLKLLQWLQHLSTDLY